MNKMNWVDFSKLKKDTYRKKLIQPLGPTEYADRLNQYFTEHKTYNVYTLCGFVGMSMGRFTSNYINSDNTEIKELTQKAIEAIAGHALLNAEDYSKSLRYIMARVNTGKDFIELDESVQEGNKAQIVILPEKKK